MSNPIQLKIRNLGHVPSKKNSKVKWFTNKRTAQWIEAAERSLLSQLSSAVQTIDGGTWTTRQLRSWIASSLPFDDSIQHITAINIKLERVPKGAEGADIVIERVE